jgi:hypothetical protein
VSIIAHTRPFVIGVDTHARNHVAAVLAPTTSEVIDSASFPTTTAGLARMINWVARRTGGDRAALWVIECAATYGARLARAVIDAGYQVVEAARMNVRADRTVGKSDPLDAHRIAAAVLPLSDDQLRWPRADEGERAALQVLLTARESMTTEKTKASNSLTALVRATDLGIDARNPLTNNQVGEISRWRRRDGEPIALATARTEAVRLAKRITALDEEITANTKSLETLVRATPGSALLDKIGFGPVTTAICETAWSHHGRVRSEAAFAALAGVNPIPASSANTNRHRLNRGGDRRLNSALYIVALTRMTHDPATRQYAEKRRKDGLTNREIRRCLKRYLARHVYRTLNTTAATPNPA